jgi:hypothetical protein
MVHGPSGTRADEVTSPIYNLNLAYYYAASHAFASIRGQA